jgi:hypothetical protein
VSDTGFILNDLDAAFASAQFERDVTHPATGRFMYSIYRLDDVYYAHAWDVNVPRVQLYRSEGGIGRQVAKVPGARVLRDAEGRCTLVRP